METTHAGSEVLIPDDVIVAGFRTPFPGAVRDIGDPAPLSRRQKIAATMLLVVVAIAALGVATLIAVGAVLVAAVVFVAGFLVRLALAISGKRPQ